MANPYNRIFNFSAGPSILPVPVLEKAQAELLNYAGTGTSVMEMSHRSAAFDDIINKAEVNLRKLLSIPDDYTVLFLQGGASLQFSMVPMNFLQPGTEAGYVVTGSWSSKAFESALVEGMAKVLHSEKEAGYKRATPWSQVPTSGNYSYISFTSNETIHGVEYHSDPGKLGAPIVCDMSSDILSRPVNIGAYDLIYAGAQKNMGPAGLTLVIVKNSFLETAKGSLGPMLDYKLQAKNKSLYNTPPCWSIYITGLVFEHLLETGGISAAHERNQKKADVLYSAIDASDGFYSGHADKDSRSLMNVTFTLPSDDLTKPFIAEAKALGLDGLKGHRSIGGCRASIYNAFPVEGCHRLIEFMSDFKSKH